MQNKFILDACCGGRCFWFNKNDPNTIYQDIRKEVKGFIPERPNFEVNPDVLGDFRSMKHFKDKSFKLVVFDPPHMKGKKAGKGWMAKKYGSLDRHNWKEDLKKGFDECWRVLDDFGVLIFKWAETSIKTKEVLKCFKQKPLFGHPTARSGATKWLCFMKIPKTPPANPTKFYTGGGSN